jgi:hypothetical protein
MYFLFTWIRFNGLEYTFLRADVPFPIVGLDLLKFFWDLGTVHPSSFAILIAPQHLTQGGGTVGDGGYN